MNSTVPLSFEKYLLYNDGSVRRYDLLDTGELIELPNENRINVLLAMALFRYLEQFVDWDLFSLNATAVQVTPITLKFNDGISGEKIRRVRQQSRIPDLMVLTEVGARQIFGKPSGLALEHDAPALIVEFVSESNASEDYIDKRAQYEARGVSEYWIADRHCSQVMVLTLTDGRYREQIYREDSVIRSALFPAFALSAQQLLTVKPR
jgi:Uma2 family endonuclease